MASARVASALEDAKVLTGAPQAPRPDAARGALQVVLKLLKNVRLWVMLALGVLLSLC